MENMSGDQKKVNAEQEWRSALTGTVGALLVAETVTGLTIYLLPFSVFNQFSVILHTLLGIGFLVPLIVYSIRHWRVRRGGRLSHYQALGYFAVAALTVCVVSGVAVTLEALIGTGLSAFWDWTHLLSGMVAALLVLLHVVMLIVRAPVGAEGGRSLVRARRRFLGWSAGGGVAVVLVALAFAASRHAGDGRIAFPEDYNWRFGPDRPFAPSLARVDLDDWPGMVTGRVRALLSENDRMAFDTELARRQQELNIGLYDRIRLSAKTIGVTEGTMASIETLFEDAARDLQEHGALDAAALSGSESCGTSGCHEEIYKEWLPSAHRYSALDDLFQQVQTLMAEETSPEQTRYCAGCHDPISLFSGAKNSDNVTLSAEGYDEGISCLVCHSIVQADTQGNADYTIRPPKRYLFERGDTAHAKLLSDFLIRSYPRQHVESYSRSLYKTAEYCAACHKQYVDTEVNTDIGRVQGQNQYDSWRKSRWHHEGEPEKDVSCRECHMPLNPSTDPAAGDVLDYNRTGDDGYHRSHRFLGGNQYIPVFQDLEYGQLHADLTVDWLRGEYPIPEIAEKWTDGPVVRMAILAPSSIEAGDEFTVQVTLTNNKTGHDFPTGPLDMIESWVELVVRSEEGSEDEGVIYHAGWLDGLGDVGEPPLIFRADGFDRKGELIDRHNLWDLVGAKYKRSIFPGFTDTLTAQVVCPALTQSGERQHPESRSAGFDLTAPAGEDLSELKVEARLWYRKANATFLRRIYGADTDQSAPATVISEASATIEVRSNA